MGRGWGYKHATTGVDTTLQRNKRLINETPAGTKVYQTWVGDGICRITVIWHDNRKNNYKSVVILKKDPYFGELPKAFDVNEFKTQKDIFAFAAKQIAIWG